MSHTYAYEPSGMHFVSCYSQEEAELVQKQCEKEGFVANIYRFGSCHFEVQYYQESY